MRYYLIAGESSGDLHGSLLIKALRKLDIRAEFRFIGGELMNVASGTKSIKPLSDFSFMGFLEVFKNLRTIFKNLTEVGKDILSFKPDALILIDFPGFNLRIAEKAHLAGIKTFYFISPKVWAWNSRRVLKIKRDIDHMLVIFPFEVKFYQEWGMKVDYVGNPLMDALENFYSKVDEPEFIRSIFPSEEISTTSRPGPTNQKSLIALLPGSRKQEIEKILPEMIKVAGLLPQFEFIIAGAPNFSEEYYQNFFEGIPIKVVFNQTYSLVSSSIVALVTSGTATLETALLGTPEVVLYKTSGISYQIAKQVIRVRYISLVNLIMDREVVSELIQGQCKATQILSELEKILPGGSHREKMLNDFLELKEKVGRSGASGRAAEKIYEYLPIYGS